MTRGMKVARTQKNSNNKNGPSKARAKDNSCARTKEIRRSTGFSAAEAPPPPSAMGAKLQKASPNRRNPPDGLITAQRETLNSARPEQHHSWPPRFGVPALLLGHRIPRPGREQCTVRWRRLIGRGGEGTPSERRLGRLHPHPPAG
jgi:hypothetical protein